MLSIFEVLNLDHAFKSQPTKLKNTLRKYSRREKAVYTGNGFHIVFMRFLHILFFVLKCSKSQSNY